MTDKKNDNKKAVKNEEIIQDTCVIKDEEIDDSFLQDEIKKIQNAENEVGEEWKPDFAPLLNKIKELEWQLKEKEEITKNSQVNYLHLKADFDILQRQTQQKMEKAERDAIIKVVKEVFLL